MKEIALGEVIAEKKLKFEDESKTDREIVVRLGKPIYDRDEGAWRCPIQTTGLGDDRVKAPYGEDSLQALWYGLQMVRIALSDFGPVPKGEFTWLWQDASDFPFNDSNTEEGHS